MGFHTVAAFLPPGHQTVLLAEGDDLLRDSLARQLRRFGYHVIVATDGPDALAKGLAHLGEVDLVLADDQLPGMPGRDLVRLLRRKQPSLSALLMNGLTGPVLTEPFRDSPPVLLKPFSARELVAAIRVATMPPGLQPAG